MIIEIFKASILAIALYVSLGHLDYVRFKKPAPAFNLIVLAVTWAIYLSI
jgi:hypothetical protein